MLSIGMSPVQWTDRTPPGLLAGGLDLIWEQEAAGSNPAIPTRHRFPGQFRALLISARLWTTHAGWPGTFRGGAACAWPQYSVSACTSFRR
jgi:hypothetical protein